jgi:hypothetical protein
VAQSVLALVAAVVARWALVPALVAAAGARQALAGESLRARVREGWAQAAQARDC